MSNLSSTTINTFIYYLGADIDFKLKDAILESLSDLELKDLFARCLSKQTKQAAHSSIRDEINKRNNKGL